MNDRKEAKSPVAQNSLNEEPFSWRGPQDSSLDWTTSDWLSDWLKLARERQAQNSN